MSIITETPRLVIREFAPDELELYLNHFNDEAIQVHIPKRTREERTAIFNTAFKQYSQTKASGIWAMFKKDDNAFVGSCLLRISDKADDTLELGYSLEQLQWGKGLATEMAEALTRYAFLNNEGMQSVIAVTTTGNVASQRVLEKAGYKKEDIIADHGEELFLFRFQA